MKYYEDKTHFLNYIRYIARKTDYKPNFNGTAIEYILFAIERYNRDYGDHAHFFELGFTEDQIEILTNRLYCRYSPK